MVVRGSATVTWADCLRATFHARNRLSAEQRDVTYEFNGEGHVVRDRTGASIVMPWSVMRRGWETAKGFYLRLKPRGVRYVPVRAFAPADLPALRALLREKLGDAAKLRGGSS